MEALVEADDVVAAVAATLGPEAGELDGALVGLGAGVAKECAPDLGLVRGGGGRLARTGVRELREPARNLAAVLDLEVVGDVQQAFRLANDSLVELGVVVAQAVHGDAGEEVQVLAAGAVREVHPLAADELDRRAAKGVHHVGVVKLLGLVVRH